MTELESILNKFEELKGQFVIYNGKVLRLVAVGKDKDDFYYILWDGYDFDTASVEELLIILKNNILDADYYSFVKEAYDIDRESTEEELIAFKKERETSLQNYYPTFEVLTEVYWDII